MKLLRYFIFLFLIASFLYGCTIYKNIEAEEGSKESQDNSETSELPDVGEMDEELDTKPLETLEENLEYIENI